MPPPRVEIHGYAILSDDDRIAGPDGATPPALRNEADWDCFQRELDRADLVALGRLGHEANPNAQAPPAAGAFAFVERTGAARRRIVVEPRQDALARRERRVAARTAGASPSRAAGTSSICSGVGYEAFHLSRAHGVRLGGGRAAFAACDAASARKSF